jgi:hypothetical protein
MDSMTTLDTRSTRRAGRIDRWSSSLRVGTTAAVVGALAMVITWLGSWNPSYWGDEVATVVSANRPIGTLIAELHSIDAVHGLYYLGMHFWIGVFGPSELSTRAPSAIAIGVLAAGTVVLGARLAGLRFGLLAGVVCAILPRTTFLATEARSYAIGTAIAVWVTVFFVGLLRRRDTGLRPWLVLGVLVYERAALWDVVAPLADVRSDLARSRSVWALELPVGTEVHEDIADLTSHGYFVVSSHLVHHTVICQLQKETS